MGNVSIIVPCRNEQDFIGSFLTNVDQLNFTGLVVEVIVADGMSDDRTQEILDKFKPKTFKLIMLKNNGKIVSTGLNRAIELARGQFVVRMDVHTWYHQDYVLECVAALQRTGAACVGGPWVALGENRVQKAIASAFQSKLISGGAKSRMESYTGYVDTVYLGAWKIETLRQIGGFDERFVRNQDDELCLRLKNLGFTIFQDAQIKSFYRPRSSFKSLFKQYFQYGYWKPLIFVKYKRTGAMRHTVVVFGILMNICLILLSLVHVKFALIYLALISVYLFLVLIASSTSISGKTESSTKLLIIWATLLMHFSYCLGLSLGILDNILKSKRNKDKMSTLSR